jgi:hypothetical protein
MKKTKFLFFSLLLLLCLSYLAKSQRYVDVTIDQPDSLQVNAGADTTIKQGAIVQLGGFPAVQGGNGGYVCNWTPSSGINNATIANPIASPTTNVTYTLTVIDEHDCSAKDSVKITLSDETGLEDINNLAFRVFPNPAKNHIFVKLNEISSSNITIALLNSSGTIIKEKKFENIEELKQPINIRNMNSGVYFIRVYNEKYSNIKKIIIK